jgi:hypothetical protein
MHFGAVCEKETELDLAFSRPPSLSSPRDLSNTSTLTEGTRSCNLFATLIKRQFWMIAQKNRIKWFK